LKDWFNDDKWDISKANSICDWAFTRLYHFKDFHLDESLKKMCIKVMAFDNYTRYLPVVVGKAVIYPINKRIIQRLREI
jgi:hypothetical protein